MQEEIYVEQKTVTNHRAPQLSEANRSLSCSPLFPMNGTSRRETFDAFHPRHQLTLKQYNNQLYCLCTRDAITQHPFSPVQHLRYIRYTTASARDT